MVTTINSYYLISILPTYYLSRDQETYLSREAWKMPSIYPTSTQYSTDWLRYNKNWLIFLEIRYIELIPAAFSMPRVINTSLGLWINNKWAILIIWDNYRIIIIRCEALEEQRTAKTAFLSMRAFHSVINKYFF